MADPPSLKRIRRLYVAVAQDKNDGRIEAVARLLAAVGYVMTGVKRGKGSHCVFRKEGQLPISIPAHRPLNKHYVEATLEIVDLEMERLFGAAWRKGKS